MASYPTALIILDMQNDLCHAEGVYARNGLAATHVPVILPNIINTVHFCHKNRIPVIATQLTVLSDIEGNAMGLGVYSKLRPFLEKDGFRPETWGYDLLDEIPKVDYRVRKWNLSAFYDTELERYLSSLDCVELVLVGFTTNGPIETTAREAISRNYKITTLIDCVASYSEALHQASITNLSSFGQVLKSEEWMQNYISNNP
ncbi:MAG: isochorismatase family cysteine hydrolase [Chlamydiota bacterium]|jgi:ureidoacrylate peracid hydrolase